MKLKWTASSLACALACAAAVALSIVGLADQSALFSPTTGTVSGLNLTNSYNNAINALNTCNAGTSAPSNQLSGSPSLGNCWLDTSSSPYALKRYDGANWVVIGWIDPTNHWWDPQFGGGSGSLASASTTDLGSNPATYLSITGTASISSFGSSAQVGSVKVLAFAGVATLVNSSNLILPTGANIGTAAGDSAIAVETASGVWRLAYFRANGQPLANTAGLITPWAITGGLPSSMGGTNTSAAMNISPFTAADQTDAAVMSDASIINWAAANGNAIGGDADGTTLQNSATYHMYACKGTSGVGAYASRVAPGTFVAASCPSGYAQYARRLFSFMTTSAGAPLQYTAAEVAGGAARFAMPAPTGWEVNNAGNSSFATARSLFAMLTPNGLVVEWHGRWYPNSNGYHCNISSPSDPDVAPAISFGTLPGFDEFWTVPALERLASGVLTDTSSQIGFRCDGAAPGLYATTTDYIDFRRI